jgi:cell division protease FtsH
MPQETKTPKPGSPDSQKKGPKFNIYMIYIIAFIALVIASFGKFSPDLIEVSQQEFENNMLIKGDVAKIDLVKNKDRVRVYLYPDSLKKEYYVTRLKKSVTSTKAKEPLFEFKVIDWKSFTESITKITTEKGLPEVKQQIVEDQDWTGPLFNTIFSLLLTIVFFKGLCMNILLQVDSELNKVILLAFKVTI